MSIDRWTDKDVAHIYNGILVSHKKNDMPYAATWMDLEIIKWNKSEKDEYHMISLAGRI